MNSESAIDEEEWSEGVYYDPETGDYVVFEFTGDAVREMNVFSDAELHVFDRDEFVEAQDDFRQINETVVGNPAGVVDDVLATATERPMSAAHEYDGIEIAYARHATILKNPESDE